MTQSVGINQSKSVMGYQRVDHPFLSSLEFHPPAKVQKKYKMDDREHVRIRSPGLDSTWNSQMLGIIFAIIAVIISLVAFSIYRSSKTKKNNILLLGLCEAGKTLIFARIVYNKFVQTHTSIKENIGDYLCGNTTFKIIDIPGHERLRRRYFDQFKTTARGLVFVLDSLSIQKDIKDVAEFLYNCLIDSYIASSMPPLLILCNKQGETLAKGSNAIKTLLEKEMNILRTTQTNQLESISKTLKSAFLGKEGKEFEFSDLHPMKIEFAECSAVNEPDKDDYDLRALEKWIKTLA